MATRFKWWPFGKLGAGGTAGTPQGPAGPVLAMDPPLGARRPLPLIGHMTVERQYSFLVTLLGLVLAGLVIVIGKDFLNASDSTAGVATAGDTLMHSQRLAKAVPVAVQGNVQAFRRQARHL